MKQNRILSFGMAQLISEEEINQVAAGQANFSVEVSRNTVDSSHDIRLDS